MFDPKTIALIGATEKEGAIGRKILENLLRSHDRGIFPVNPNASKVLGIKSYPDISSIPEKVMLAVVAVPARSVPKVVEQCGRSGVDGVIIISSGFKEAGEEGAQLEREVDLIREKYGMRIMGPNCVGFMRPSLGLNTSFLLARPSPGNIAFISQSGALGGAILDWAVSAGIGFSLFASLGSMVDIDFGDMIDFLGNDPDTRSILIYMEDVGNAKNFMSAAREFARRKPIIILKPGRYEQSARAARSHTGATAGDDAVYDAVFKRVGALRVGEISELFEAAAVLDSQRLPAGRRLAIVTCAGGPGVIAADALMDRGGELARLSDESMKQLDAILPPYWSRNNPVDVHGDATVDRFMQAVSICLADPMVDALLVIYVPMESAPSTRFARAVAEVAKKWWKPVVAAWMGAKDAEEGRRILVDQDIPVYDTPEQAVRNYMNLYEYKRNLDKLYQTPEALPEPGAPFKNRLKELLGTAVEQGRTILSEDESRDFLTSYGIPAATQTSVTDIDCELTIRARKDMDFGSVILFGMGGKNAGFFKDFSVGLPPLDQTLAKILIQNTKVCNLLRSFSGKRAADFEELEHILVNFSNLVVDFPQIAEIEINPLAVSNGRPLALDARITIDTNLDASARSPYPHLVITPYPTKYITHWRLPDGTDVLVRPIRPEDEPAEQEMLSSLSMRTLQTRFFSTIKNIGHEWLILLCNVDYDRHIAIVAEVRENEKTRIIGDARLIMGHDPTYGEVAVLVHDDFQGKGLGTKFVEMLVEIAREKDLDFIRADVLTENTRMLHVFKRLGFTTQWFIGGKSEAVLKLK